MNGNGLVRTAHPTLDFDGKAGCRVRRAHHFELYNSLILLFAKRIWISFTGINFNGRFPGRAGPLSMLLIKAFAQIRRFEQLGLSDLPGVFVNRPASLIQPGHVALMDHAEGFIEICVEKAPRQMNTGTIKF